MIFVNDFIKPLEALGYKFVGNNRYVGTGDSDQESIQVRSENGVVNLVWSRDGDDYMSSCLVRFDKACSVRTIEETTRYIWSYPLPYWVEPHDMGAVVKEHGLYVSRTEKLEGGLTRAYVRRFNSPPHMRVSLTHNKAGNVTSIDGVPYETLIVAKKLGRVPQLVSGVVDAMAPLSSAVKTSMLDREDVEDATYDGGSTMCITSKKQRKTVFVDNDNGTVSIHYDAYGDNEDGSWVKLGHIPDSFVDAAIGYYVYGEDIGRRSSCEAV